MQPLSGGSPPGADVEVIRIESGAASGGEARVRDAHRDHEEAHDRTRVRGMATSRRGRPRPMPTAPARPAETASTVGAEQPGTSLAALIQEAESLHAALADAKSRTARLIAGLRRQRKQSRLVNETLKSLRQLRLVETAG